MPPFSDLFERLQQIDEDSRIEAKTSSEMGEAVLRTVCAFANEPGAAGGYLLLGVARTRTEGASATYDVVGVANPDGLQADLANQCVNAFNEVIRPEVEVQVVDGKRVVVVFIPESEAGDKPIYLKKVGLPKGAFRRIGSADHRCTDNDVALLYNLRTQGGYDSGLVSGATLADVDRDAVREYRKGRAAINPTAEELKLSTVDLLKALGAVIERSSNVALTRAGLLLFGKRSALRRLLPSARIDYIMVPGNEWVANPTERYRSIEVTLPLLMAIPKLVDLVVQDLPKAVQ